MEILAREYGIIPNKDVTVELRGLLDSLRGNDEHKDIIFDKGEYFFSVDKTKKRVMYITNTIGEKEWKDGETPNLNSSAIDIVGINNLCLKGEGCIFTLEGQMNNMSIIDSENVTISGIKIRHINPDMHALKVVGKGLFHIDFELDKESKYEMRDSIPYCVGKDYAYPLNSSTTSKHWDWIGYSKSEDVNTIVRTAHPFNGCIGVKEIAPYRFRANYLFRRNVSVGDRFYIFEIRRKHVGIFADRCKNLRLDRVEQNFNYSLAIVCQDCENIEITNCRFKPEKGSEKLMCSVADFIQICMCRGQVNIIGNEFEGAGDDCLNTHGFHYKIKSVQSDRIVVRYSHPQSFGFNPLKVGDKFKYVNPYSLLESGRGEILESKLINPYDIELKVSNTENAKVGHVIEDVDACPDLNFSHNVMDRIITRGILITTSGKVEVKDNKFLSTSMHSILISDDAISWYESGNVTDVTIEDNYFGKCPDNMYNVYIKPENIINKGYVHSNIKIIDNVFDSGKGRGIFVKCAKDVYIGKNDFKHEKRIVTQYSDVYED